MAGSAGNRTSTRLPETARHSMHGSSTQCALPAWGAQRLILAAVMLAAASMVLSAQSITVTVAGANPNNWTIGSYGPANIGLPGTDFTTTTVTGPNPTVTISTAGYAAGRTVRVLISKAADAATTWNSSYTLWVRRRNQGSGGGTFAWSLPAATYVQIPTAPATLQLFTFQRSRNNVTIQLQVQNLTVAAGTPVSTNFLTTLTYTAVWP
jgi:hypothetical protein